MVDTLARTYSDLQLRVASYLAIASVSGDISSLSASDSDKVEDCVKSGLSQFYHPEIVNGSATHQWSFMEPTGTITTVAGTGDYDLPTDLTAVISPLTYESTDSRVTSITMIEEWRLREARERADNSEAPPIRSAVTNKSFDGSSAQRYQIMLEPVPDAAYTLRYRYKVQGEMLTDSNGYPYGGAEHAETILESCLAIAEGRYNDDLAGTNHQERFMRFLAASISRDRRSNQAWNLGYNGDRSDLSRSRSHRPYGYGLEVTTVNGSQP